MPNSLDSTGLTLATRAELLANLTLALQGIYGTDINLASDSPDGQQLNIFVQAIGDIQDLLMGIYTSFDPDQAVGAILDQRVGINGIQRQAGTYTTTYVSITVNRSVTLFGLDQSAQTPFTIADNAGNQWSLLSSIVLASSGTSALLFRAANPGAVLTTLNSITVPVTVVLGVTAINNPTTYSTLGINEESDTALKLRRQQSVALSSQGYVDGLLAALKNISGMSSAYVYENITGTTDANGVPGHAIWVIVAGSASSADIAYAIYRKRNAGCGFKAGAQSYTIIQKDGTPFTIYWDVVTQVPLYFRFMAQSLDGVNPPNIALIQSQLPLLLIPGVAQQVNVNMFSTVIQKIDPNTLVVSAGFSTTPNGTFVSTLSPSAKNQQFAISGPNIIATPIVILPYVSSGSYAVAKSASKTFTAQGGYGALTWSIQTNNSGGSINSTTGVYTAGTTAGTDTIKVSDSSATANSSTVSVVVS